MSEPLCSLVQVECVEIIDQVHVTVNHRDFRTKHLCQMHLSIPVPKMKEIFMGYLLLYLYIYIYIVSTINESLLTNFV